MPRSVCSLTFRSVLCPSTSLTNRILALFHPFSAFLPDAQAPTLDEDHSSSEEDSVIGEVGNEDVESDQDEGFENSFLPPEATEQPPKKRSKTHSHSQQEKAPAKASRGVLVPSASQNRQQRRLENSHAMAETRASKQQNSELLKALQALKEELQAKEAENQNLAKQVRRKSSGKRKKGHYVAHEVPVNEELRKTVVGHAKTTLWRTCKFLADETHPAG